jgi:uncharacterized protein
MYMDAVQAIGGSGGWPLNVFATADRAPFYGGTYYPPRPAYNRPSWTQLLHRMNEIWNDQHDEVTLQTEQIIKHLTQASQKTFAGAGTELSKELPRKVAESLLKQADTEKGGFGNAPKFPGTMAISFLLEHFHFTGHEASLKHALRSLDAMIYGGIYDQLGGGFARYSTDREWLAPHFEKMLYDNALLISSLADAFSITRNERYRKIIDETIAFTEQELTDETGGYYCAIDADSEGVEGKFYTWTWEEWVASAGPFGNALDAEIAEQYFGVKREGNWEATNILHVAKNTAVIAVEKGIAEDVIIKLVNEVKCRLLAHRETRIRPITDDKCLLSWNALMNIALCKAGVVLKNEKYLLRAAEQMQWMLEKFEQKGQLLHTWKKDIARIPGKLDDYAYLVQALLQLAAATGENIWVLKANELMEFVIAEFSFNDCLFYYTPEHQADIPVRKVDTYDSATPSANAIMAHNLWICGMCMEKSDWVERSGRMVEALADSAVRYSYSFSYWAILLQRKTEGMKTVVCASEHAETVRSEMLENYVPQAYLVTSTKKISEIPIIEKKYFDGKMYIFVCSEQACLSPVASVDAVLRVMKE